MAPVVTKASDLDVLYEAFDVNTHEFMYTAFTLIDEDDIFYYGQLNIAKLEITFEQFTSALQRLPDEDILPEVPSDATLTVAPDKLELGKDAYYIKRPRVTEYEDYKNDDCLSIISLLLLEEAQALQLASLGPHPGIIRYHGCHVRRGRITGLVLDRHEYDLKGYLRENVGHIDKEVFMAALESAVRHLHSMGLAHNDINPRNILINAAGMPVLVDFGSCRKVGEKLGSTRGTPGWVEGPMEEYTTSEERHDTFAIGKIRDWLDNPTF